MRLEVDTTYPFDGEVTVRIGLSAPTPFALRLRVPGWCEDATFSVNGDPCEPPVEHGFAVLRREWRKGDVVTMTLPLALRHQDSVMRRGPVLLALALAEDWRPVRSRHRVPDWEVRTNSPWAFAIDEASSAQVHRRPIPAGQPGRSRGCSYWVRRCPFGWFRTAAQLCGSPVCRAEAA